MDTQVVRSLFCPKWCCRGHPGVCHRRFLWVRSYRWHWWGKGHTGNTCKYCQIIFQRLQFFCPPQYVSQFQIQFNCGCVGSNSSVYLFILWDTVSGSQNRLMNVWGGLSSQELAAVHVIWLSCELAACGLTASSVTLFFPLKYLNIPDIVFSTVSKAPKQHKKCFAKL